MTEYRLGLEWCGSETCTDPRPCQYHAYRHMIDITKQWRFQETGEKNS